MFYFAAMRVWSAIIRQPFNISLPIEVHAVTPQRRPFQILVNIWLGFCNSSSHDVVIHYFNKSQLVNNDFWPNFNITVGEFSFPDYDFSENNSIYLFQNL